MNQSRLGLVLQMNPPKDPLKDPETHQMHCLDGPFLSGVDGMAECSWCRHGRVFDDGKPASNIR